MKVAQDRTSNIRTQVCCAMEHVYNSQECLDIWMRSKLCIQNFFKDCSTPAIISSVIFLLFPQMLPFNKNAKNDVGVRILYVNFFFFRQQKNALKFAKIINNLDTFCHMHICRFMSLVGIFLSLTRFTRNHQHHLLQIFEALCAFVRSIIIVFKTIWYFFLHYSFYEFEMKRTISLEKVSK